MSNHTVIPIEAVFDRDTGQMVGFHTTGGVVTPLSALTPSRVEGSSVTLALTDNGGISLTPVDCTVTVNTFADGFGRGFQGLGSVSFNGTATVQDRRTSVGAGSYYVCGLVSTNGNNYDCIGSKP